MCKVTQLGSGEASSGPQALEPTHQQLFHAWRTTWALELDSSPAVPLGTYCVTLGHLRHLSEPRLPPLGDVGSSSHLEGFLGALNEERRGPVPDTTWGVTNGVGVGVHAASSQ